MDPIKLFVPADRRDHLLMSLHGSATDDDSLRNLWLRFAREECGEYTPLYRRICESVADDVELLRFTASGQPHARQPNLLLAAVHSIVLRGHCDGDLSAMALAEVYREAVAGRNSGSCDVGQLFIDVCRDHRDELAELLATRFTQTNECGRSAPLALGLYRIATDHGSPGADGVIPATLALIDAGCSAGLNLAVDHYVADFGSVGSIEPAERRGPATGDASEPVRVHCEVLGPNADALAPLPNSLDVVGWRVGVERAPVDLGDEDAVRWLVACVFPDHAERLDRARRALAALARHPPPVIRGDMVDDLGAAIESAPDGQLVTVLTSWAAAYLSGGDRKRFVEVMTAASFQRPIVWLSMEAPGVVRGLERPDFEIESPTSPSLVGYLRFEYGNVTPVTLGWTHPHGAWFAPVHR